LEFYLKPHPEGIDGQSVVALVGGGEVSFKNCVVTLNGVRRPPLAVVLLTNPKDLLPLPPAEGGTAARVVLDNCFCRGDGDLVWTRANRPFQLEVKNTLAGLTGSLVNVESSVREAPMAGANPRVSISLTRLTAYLGNNLIRLDVPDLKGLIPVGVDQAASCLFVPAEGRALLHFQGLRTPEEIVREMVSWKGEQNLYSTHFLSMFDQQASALEMPLDLVSQAKWKDFAVESDSKFVPVKFFGPLWPALPAAEMVRENFRIDYGPQNAGANLDQLPVPQDSIR
jgi:hypothetical protein